MPDSRKHRGPGPQDPIWFGPSTRPQLLAAVSDLSWLLSRDYGVTAAIKLVGDRYRLVERQRMAVLRSACTDAALADRKSRQTHIATMRGRSLQIDGFNLILTLESALSGGVVLGGRDGCFRDLASVHGTYRRVEETRPALELADQRLKEWEIGPCTWFLDSPVSNSGRLAAMIRALHSDWQVEVVANPDSVLVQSNEVVATADAAVLDRCGAWLNLARIIVETNIANAFIVDLSQ